MAFQPGHKHSPGREKGVPNKSSLSLIRTLNDMGMGDSLDHPVVWMFKVAHGLIDFEFAVDGTVIGNVPADSNQRITCMKEVAKYVSPQLKAIDHTVAGDQDNPIKHVVEYLVVSPKDTDTSTS